MEAIAIKTKAGYYISDNIKNDSYWNGKLGRLFFDGKNPEKTFHPYWVFIKTLPKKIQEEKSQPDINHRYVLIDETMKSDKLPQILKREDVAERTDYWEWKKEYSHLQSLYKLESDKQPSIMEDVEINIKVILELNEIKKINGFSYPVPKTHYASDGMTSITEKNVEHQLIDKILFPEICLPEKPCMLTSEQSYKIVRQFIKDNINSTYAEITSDYDFCFTVQKKIPIGKPYDYKAKTMSWTKRRPQLKTVYVKDRLVECFEMTYSPENYRGYTPIKGFEGKDHNDLKNHIDNYCKEVIKNINKPLIECKHCNGQGVILEKDL